MEVIFERTYIIMDTEKNDLTPLKSSVASKIMLLQRYSMFLRSLKSVSLTFGERKQFFDE